MRQGPDITRIAALIGDPARAGMLSALMGGQALTARELAEAAGVTPATASGHLSQMTEAGLLWSRKQGRHRYYALADDEVARALETLAGLAHARGHAPRPGPRDEALREARVCYDHLAGQVAVHLFDSMAGRGYLTVDRDDIALSPDGAGFVRGLGIDPDALGRGRPLVRTCLDWSARRSHLAGALGAAFLTRFENEGWLRRHDGSRHVTITPPGRAALATHFGRLPAETA